MGLSKNGEVSECHRGKNYANYYLRHWKKGDNFVWRVIWTEEMRCVLSMPFGKPRRGNCLEQLDQDFQTYDKRAQNGGRKISLAHGIHCCPRFYLFYPSSVSVLWRICMYIHISTCIDTVYDYRFYQIILGVRVLHKTRAVTGYLPLGCWPTDNWTNTWHWHWTKGLIIVFFLKMK